MAYNQLVTSLYNLSHALKLSSLVSSFMKLSDNLSGQEIYDFYAIVGSEVSEEFADEITSFALKLGEEFEKAVRSRVSVVWNAHYQGILTRDEWVALGGSADNWDYFYEMFKEVIREYPEEHKLFGKCLGIIEDDNEYFRRTEEADLSDDQIDNLFDMAKKIKPFTLTAQGVWKKAWDTLKRVRKEFYSSNLNRKIIAIDTLLGITHHAGPILDYIGESDSAQALNAKFNARTVADFWDKVNPKLRIQINKARRQEQLPIIAWNVERDPKIFTKDPHKD